MTARIPDAVRDELSKSDFMKVCCFCGNDKPQWHHNLIHGGRQVQEVWAILPLCKSCHDQVNIKSFRRLADWVMWNRAPHEAIDKYSNVLNYKAHKEHLNSMFGEFRSEKIKALYANLYNQN